MDLLILGKSFDNPRYRGVARESPSFVEYLPTTHAVNQLFSWYLYTGDSCVGPVHELEKSIELIKQYRMLPSAQEFELVEITQGDAAPTLSGSLLGFDVHAEYAHSILASGLPERLEAHRRACEEDLKYSEIAPLIVLFGKHFGAMLNHHLLFASKEAAEFCLHCAVSLIKLYPALFDIPYHSLVVTGLYSVPSEVRNGK